ncbi:expressed unknown protein [Seminavis robusta]|uniref:Secreted protein n=1 Tax=Seminavis robusta TaxID=568900 RepID=A0A9N8E470_9STRA|nr:expressed unknown protein [Seminavis robusta]|eukprot:Sro484_g152281.1  (102) ;mRNA; r:51842-52147
MSIQNMNLHLSVYLLLFMIASSQAQQNSKQPPNRNSQQIDRLLLGCLYLDTFRACGDRGERKPQWTRYPALDSPLQVPVPHSVVVAAAKLSSTVGKSSFPA